MIRRRLFGQNLKVGIGSEFEQADLAGTCFMASIRLIFWCMLVPRAISNWMRLKGDCTIKMRGKYEDINQRVGIPEIRHVTAGTTV